MSLYSLSALTLRTGLRAGTATVYGADWCGWTKKQLAYLDARGTSYNFVDCDKQSCPSFVAGFPTTVLDDGRILRGFTEI